MTTTFVVDTDPGIDDALALLLAARASAARLGAVTVTYGNTTLDRAARNARCVLDRAPSDAPVLAGWDRPLRRPLIAAFAATVTIGILLIGYLFNFLIA